MDPFLLHLVKYMYIHIYMRTEKQSIRKTLVSDAHEAVRECAGMQIRMAARQVTRFLEVRMEKAGLSLAQFGLMANIAIAEDDRIGAIAEQVGIDPSTLSRNLRSLERAGLIEITIAEADQRCRAVWLTENGARHLEAAIPIWRQAHKVLCEILDPAAVRKMVDSVMTLADAGLIPADR